MINTRGSFCTVSQSKLKLWTKWRNLFLFPQASEDSQNYEPEVEQERTKQEHERHPEGPDRVTVEMMDSTDVPVQRLVVRPKYKKTLLEQTCAT